MSETPAEKRKRLQAAIDRARANPNSSDKGTAGADAVDAMRRKMKANGKAISNKSGGGTDMPKRTRHKREMEIYDAVENAKKGG